MRKNGTALLLGIASDDISPLPRELADRIVHSNYARMLRSDAGGDLRGQLHECGLRELRGKDWMKAPRAEHAATYLTRLNQRLDEQNVSGDVRGLTILDPNRAVTYYPRRWVAVQSQDGRFVARRKQAYGADQWCYIELSRGDAKRILDLPRDDPRHRGCDEAWRLQAAIDYTRGNPQVFETRSDDKGGTTDVLFYSPVPGWARKRWHAIGEAVEARGCLFSYRFDVRDLPEELDFIARELWLRKGDDPTEQR